MSEQTIVQPMPNAIPRPTGMTDPNVYGLHIDTDAYAPELHRGDVALFSPAAECKKGDLVAIRFTGSAAATIRRLLMPPRVPVGTPLHPQSDAIPAVIFEASGPRSYTACRITELASMHRFVGVYRESTATSALEQGGAA